MKEEFYIFTIFVIWSALSDRPPGFPPDHPPTPGTGTTIDYHEYFDQNDTFDFNGTTDSTTDYTGDTSITKLSTRSVSTRSTLSSRPTFDTPRTTLSHRYVFESVDYEILPSKLRLYSTDCYGQFISCIRHRTDHYPVCAFNTHTRYYLDFYSPCEIERQNCMFRMKRGLGVYGTNYTNDIIFYNGEGLDCLYYLRRARNKEEMHKIYFGGINEDDDDEDKDY